MDIIQAEGLLKRRGRGFMLGRLDFRLGPGEVLGVTGPEGAGKTTLLRLLWGFLRPDAGRISVFGRTPHLDQVWIRLRAGYLPESLRFYEWMTGAAFLAFMEGFYPNWDPRRLDAVLDLLGLDPQREIRTLEKGGRAKLGLAAAVAHRPELLILDEPGAGLDPLGRMEILSFLRSLAREDGVAIVLSSRTSDDLDRLADSVLALDAGTAVEHGGSRAGGGNRNGNPMEGPSTHAADRIRAPRLAHRA